jgi:hypothetical protein
MNRKSMICLLAAALFALSLLLGCNDSPTVPIPPPEAWYILTPNEDGYAVVVGLPGAADEGDAAVVHNKNSDEYAMDAVEGDGSFEVAIPAEVGDIVVLQIMRGNNVSEESDEKEVPSD